MTTKKTKFSTFFLKRFIPLTIAAAILCAIGTSVLCYVMSDVFYSTSSMMEFEMMYGRLEETKFKGTTEDNFSYVLGLFSDCIVENHMGAERAAVVTDSETGEIVTTSEMFVSAVVSYEDREMNRVLICRDKEVIDFYLKYEYKINDMYASIDFDTIYVKDGKFIPGKVTVTELTGDLGMALDVIEERDFTPENIDGYEIIGTGYNDCKMLLTSCMGTYPESKLLADLVSAVQGKQVDDADNDVMDLYIAYDNAVGCYWREFECDNEKYMIYYIVTYDFWEFFLTPLIIDYVVTFVIVFAVCLIWAKLSYTKYSAKYEIDEARRNMVNALAHDLKSPLTAVSGYAENLAADVHPEKKDYYAKSIMENAAYMNAIITSTLELSRTEDGGKLHTEQLDVSALVNELYSKYSLEAESRGISFGSEGKCIVNADKALITSALDNLIANAVKFTPDGGKISVTSEQKFLTIKNTCDSADKLAQLNLTEPFVKGDESRTNRTGTGLGLSIAKSACERQGFRLIVKPEGREFIAEIRFR